jgi:tripartite-type tricarboxylate transporter receptor subunit TctC
MGRPGHVGGLAGALLAMLCAGTAGAVDFSGKRIELLVPYEAGGGTDLYARYLAPLIADKLPGKPTVVINNVEGAGAIAGSNQFQERAKPDGLSLVAVAASVTSNYVFRDKRVRYKLDTWIPIISSPAGTVVYSRTDAGATKAGDVAGLKGKKLVMGANNPSGGDMRVLLSTDLLDLDVKPVYGINRGDARPSFERGEFSINFDSTQAYPTQVVPLVRAGTAVPLFSFGIADATGAIVRDPTVSDLPTFVEVYKSLMGKDPSGPGFEAWKAVFNLNVMASKALALPAGTPADIVDAYNKAMAEVVAEMNKPENKAKADDIVGPYPQSLGTQAGDVLRGAVKFDETTYAWLQDWIAKATKGQK